MSTILLTSAGGLTGIYLCKHYKKTSTHRIIAVDVNEYNPLKLWSDKFYNVPLINDSEYLKIIKDICIKENVDFIIPITSLDIDFFSKKNIKEYFNETPFLICDSKIQNLLSNKRVFYEYISKLGLKAPIVYKDKKDIKFPAVIKPEVSSGSKNTYIINDIEDYNYYINKINNPLVLEYLEGKEYTVDCLFGKHGKCRGYSIRERVKVSGGGATISKLSNYIDIKSIIHIFEDIGEIKGAINFQFKLKNNGVYLFDFNTRFASGGLPLSVKSGFDIPNLLISLLKDEYITDYYPNKSDNLTMIRYYEEYFE